MQGIPAFFCPKSRPFFPQELRPRQDSPSSHR
uniref:Uncharacterized protein n=1 Tax=Arundo donax TaxID=35708 RepID=A0A0A9CZ21_ARUDO